MSSLEGLVQHVVNEFMMDGVLFTALDVSNKVKETSPMSRHKEIRDIVRGLYGQLVMDNMGYGRTPIQVHLIDGSMADALLYHPLADSWDLDTKYDSQKREQTSSIKPVAIPAVQPQVNVSAVIPAPVQVSTPALIPVQTSAIDAWNNLFNTQPSLFPRKQQ